MRTRRAWPLLEDGALSELYYESAGHKKSLVGEYLSWEGLQNILPGMNAAFVDIGTGEERLSLCGRRITPR